jgi:hypothetical protein
MDKLERAKTYKEKEDMNFGQHYDPERHIKELSGKTEIQKQLNQDQAVIERTQPDTRPKRNAKKKRDEDFEYEF